MSGSVSAMAAPSGKVTFTAAPEKAARSLSSRCHSRGFFALATLPVSR